MLVPAAAGVRYWPLTANVNVSITMGTCLSCQPLTDIAVDLHTLDCRPSTSPLLRGRCRRERALIRHCSAERLKCVSIDGSDQAGLPAMAVDVDGAAACMATMIVATTLANYFTIGSGNIAGFRALFATCGNDVCELHEAYRAVHTSTVAVNGMG